MSISPTLITIAKDNLKELFYIYQNTEKGQLIKYIRGNFLGFAKCYQVQSTNDSTNYAVKIIQKSSLSKSRSRQKLMSEIKIHKNLSHQNIVKFKNFFEDNQNVYIIMELCNNSTMNELLKKKKKLSQAQIQFYMIQLLSALKYIHSQKIIHRDLKLGNLFLTDKNVLKLGDYGLASRLQFQGQKKKTICGTPNYIAPQVLQGKNGHSYQVDIWSFGIIMYTLTFGRPPFESLEVKQTYRKIKSGIFSFPQSVQVSPQIKNLIKQILQKQPLKRPTLQKIMQHQFFKSKTYKYYNPKLDLKLKKSHQKSRDKILSDLNNIITYKSKKQMLGQNQEKVFTDRKNLKKQFKGQNIIATKNKSQSEFRKMEQYRTNLQKPFKINYSEMIVVKKWIDYSSKYGLGYILTNGQTGIYFNDSTKMVSNNVENFYYIQRKKQSKEDQAHFYTSETALPQLKKKISLFCHFKNYLQIQKSQIKIQSNCLSVYVKRWFRAKHAVMFRLNNKMVQVIFVDQSQLIINSQGKMIHYTGKKGERYQMMISEVFESNNRELIKRQVFFNSITSDFNIQKIYYLKWQTERTIRNQLKNRKVKVLQNLIQNNEKEDNKFIIYIKNGYNNEVFKKCMYKFAKKIVCQSFVEYLELTYNSKLDQCSKPKIIKFMKDLLKIHKIEKDMKQSNEKKLTKQILDGNEEQFIHLKDFQIKINKINGQYLSEFMIKNYVKYNIICSFCQQFQYQNHLPKTTFLFIFFIIQIQIQQSNLQIKSFSNSRKKQTKKTYNHFNQQLLKNEESKEKKNQNKYL